MTNKPLTLSLVIPVYNEEHHLKACLDAVASQTVMPDEVLVVDNNSTDASVEIAKRYPFVSVLHETTQGVGHARTKGFDAAKSEIIGRIDADTLLPKNWVATAKKLFVNQRFAAINGPVFYYDMPYSPKNYWIDHRIRLSFYLGDKRTPFLFGSNCAVRRSAWLDVRSVLCQSRNVHEDLDLAIHLNQNGFNILYDKRLLAGTSARRYDDSFKAFRKYMAMYLHSYRKHGINRLSPRLASLVYWSGYFSTRFLRRGKTTPRKNPMA